MMMMMVQRKEEEEENYLKTSNIANCLEWAVEKRVVQKHTFILECTSLNVHKLCNKIYIQTYYTLSVEEKQNKTNQSQTNK